MLHIVPLPTNPVEANYLPLRPTLLESLEIVREGRISTVASLGVQGAIHRRIKGYPTKAGEAMHTAKMVLPIRVAKVRGEREKVWRWGSETGGKGGSVGEGLGCGDREWVGGGQTEGFTYK